MTRLWLKRLALAIGLLVLPGLDLGATAPTGDPPPVRKSLRGHFLIAAPTMGDPRFRRTVILMVRHDAEGAFGIVLNRLIGRQTLAEILEAVGEKVDAQFSVPVYAGGPVSPGRGFIVHSAEYRRPETKEVDGRVSMTSSREILVDIANAKGPDKWLIAFGYSGWGPGQLESEMARNDWFVAPEDPRLVFDEDRDKLWDAAMARRTRDL
ncbi:MAG: YqgE/AlgH family protein [Rhodospirillales bacterium]